MRCSIHGGDYVFNAFRHHGVYRPGAGNDSANKLSVQRLSASRSISGSGLWTGLRSSTRVQRLSASRSISGGTMDDIRSHASACSTPFGITEYIGCRALWTATPRCSVQRLSASRSISVGRLRKPIPRHLPVFNAFRHHGVYRAAALCGRRYHVVVFNAFRHHGVYRSLHDTSLLNPRVECSTPFGITEYIGQRVGRRRRPSKPVFNAFRHHGVYRSCARTCSRTP